MKPLLKTMAAFSIGFGSIVETDIKWKPIGYTQHLSNILKSKIYVSFKLF